MHAENVVRFVVDDELGEGAILRAWLVAEGVAFRRGTVWIHTDAHLVAAFARLCFGETDVGDLRMGEGDCWQEIVARPAFVGRSGAFVMVVGEDVCLIVRFVAKLLTSVDIAKGVDAIDARFEKFVRADPAAAVQLSDFT